MAEHISNEIRRNEIRKERNVNYASSSRHDRERERELSTRKLKENLVLPFYQIRYPSTEFKVIGHEP